MMFHPAHGTTIPTYHPCATIHIESGTICFADSGKGGYCCIPVGAGKTVCPLAAIRISTTFEMKLWVVIVPTVLVAQVAPVLDWLTIQWTEEATRWLEVLLDWNGPLTQKGSGIRIQTLNR